MTSVSDNLQVKILSSAEGVAQEGARCLIETARGRSGALVALSGGSTPKTMYDVLRGSSAEDAEALRSAFYFFGDERTVDNYHADSNVELAVSGFVRALKIPHSHLVAPDGAAANLDEEAARLTHRLHDHAQTNAAGVPVFDLIFLGMGTDGHTASLFPNTAGLTNTAPGFIANEVRQLNTWRLTLTFPVLNAARRVVILCTGGNKATVLRRIFDGTGSEFPITRVRGENVQWLLDEAAASLLPKSVGVQ